jgi:hypothetical protein
MGLFSFFWDLSQEQRLREARSTVEGHAVDARATRSELGEVRDAVDRLAMVNQALWEIVQERLTLDPDDLAAKVREIDGRDGRIDGRMTAGVTVCAACQRPNAGGRMRCLYCGAALQ